MHRLDRCTDFVIGYRGSRVRSFARSNRIAVRSDFLRRGQTLSIQCVTIVEIEFFILSFTRNSRPMSEAQLMRLNPPDEATMSYKFILIGRVGVGKTALLKRLVDDSFNVTMDSTVGVEFDSTILIVDDRKIRLQIWDTAGQEKFRSITKAYYRTAAGVLVVFDIADRKSFDELPAWVSDVRALCDPATVAMLVGSKSDLGDERTVTILEGEAFARQNRMPYIETSAKTGDNVKDAFIRIIATLQDRVEAGPRAPGARGALMGSAADSGAKDAERSCC